MGSQPLLWVDMKIANATMIEDGDNFSNYTCSKDFRANGYPCDEKGKPIYLSNSNEDYICYIEWLADYISSLNLVPIKEHAKLCEEIATHPVYSYDASRAVAHIAFEFVYGEGNRGRCNKKEREYRKKFWPRKFGSMPPGVIYRVPLSIVLKKIENHQNKVRLLQFYFSQVAEYLDK